ncbi:MAG TPA: hypothetical protein VFA83_19090 [Acidimicrobiales bacterium]|nr:hypothetical protein [Acidimicrobiales bacterium]
MTFLFTDIEGSTRRWEADPDEMREALALHDEVLRSAIEAFGGWIFKHTGDGVCAAFSSPRAAVEAAVDAQRGLGLGVRMGIATGEAEPRGEDYFGPVLNRTARVMAAGHGGQILLAGETAGLVRGVELIDLGGRQLRDLAEPVHVFQVCADGLRAEFPPLRTVDGTPGNLRGQATSFVGRDAELVAVTELVRAGRLVTLTGVGGVGKTRLALQAATHLVGDFPEGVWVIELAPIGDPTAVPDAAATVLGITQQAGMSVADSVAAALEGRLRLLVFDNCEHVVDAVADLIDTILARSATVKVLATSREGMGAADEHLWPVPPLSVREGVDSAAVSLFIERAQAVVPQFAALTGTADAEAVLEICRRLDGIPLAIELAASRMVSMSPAEVRDRLDDRFRLLAGSRRGLERHQTLRQAVQWSYDLLSGEERALLGRCSVFSGGFDLAAATAVGGDAGVDEYVVLDLLDALVRKSLLTVERPFGRTRYTMLETIRQFAEEQLSRSGDSDAARGAHARYFADCQDQLLALWNGPRQREANEWVEIELANLRSACRWAASQGDLDAAASIAISASFVGFWAQRYEPLGWAEDLIEPARACDHRQLAVLYAAASSCGTVGRIEEGVVYSEAAQALLDDPRYEAGPFRMVTMVAGAYAQVGRPDRFVELSEMSLRTGDDPVGLIRASLVFALSLAGRQEEAAALSDNVVRTAEVGGNPYLMGNALLGYAFARRDTDPAAAMTALRRAVVIASENGNRNTETHSRLELARLEAAHSDRHAALPHLAAAISAYHDSGETTSLRSPLAVLAGLLDTLGHHHEAATIVGFALSPLTEMAYPEIAATREHVREVLGNDVFDAQARKGSEMDTSSMARYALEQISQIEHDI